MARSRGRKRGGVGGHAIDDVLPQGWSDLAKDLMSPESVRRFSAPVAPISPPSTASTGVRGSTGFGGYRAPSLASVRAPSVASTQSPPAVFSSPYFSFSAAVDRPPSAASTQSHSAAGVSSYVSLSASSDRPPTIASERPLSIADDRPPTATSTQSPSSDDVRSYVSFSAAGDRSPSVANDCPPSVANTQSPSTPGVSSYDSLLAASDHWHPPAVASEHPPSIANDCLPTVISTQSPSSDDVRSYGSLSAADDHPPSVASESSLLVTHDRSLSPLLVTCDRPTSPLLVTSDHIDPIPTAPLPSAASVCPPSVTSSRAPSVDSVHSSPVAGDHSPLVANWQSVSVASDCSSPVASDRSLAPDDPTAHVIIPSSLADEESDSVSTPSSYEQISLSDRFWFDDGSVVLRLENTLYKVHRSLLEAQSSFFRKKLAEKNQPEDICNIYTSCSTDDFELVLSFVYPTAYGPNAERSTSEWLRAFYASTSLDFPALRDAAIVALTPTLPALTRLQIGRKFDVPGWTLGAYHELCERAESLTLEEARELGFADVVRLARAREMIARGGVWAEVEEMFAADPEPDAGPEPKASEPKTEPEPLTSAVGDPDGCGCQICTRHSVSMEALSLN